MRRRAARTPWLRAGALLAWLPVVVIGVVSVAAAAEPALGSRNLRLELNVAADQPAAVGRASTTEAIVEVVALTGPRGGEIVRTLSLRAPGSTTLQLPAGGHWMLRTSAGGYWAPEVGVLASGAETATRITLTPAGEVTGRVTVDGGDGRQVPGELQVRFEPSDFEKRGEGIRGLATCPIQPGGRWSCELPLGIHDLRLKAAGFASHFRWQVPVRPTGKTHLGSVALVPGAGLFGFVESEGVLDPETVQVHLVPVRPQIQDHATGRRLAALERVTDLSEDGFFQFDDLVPGSYRVVVAAPGYAELRTDPVQVLPSLESDLGRALILRRPARLDVWIEPAMHPTYGSPWAVTLSPRLPDLDPVETEADVLGFARLEELAAGAYDVRISAEDDERWGQRRLQLGSGEQTATFQLPLVRVVGNLLRDGDPVRARLTFGRLNDEEKILLYSDLDGRFEGYLPRDGEWPLHLLYTPGGAQQFIGSVHVEVGRDGVANLDVEVAATELRGRVLDRSGQPVAGAQVYARRQGDLERAQSRTRTDASGSYEWVGLPEGHYTVSAFEGRRSGRTGVDVGPTPLSNITVVLGDTLLLHGTVTGMHGPVAGAVVQAFPVLAHPRMTSLPRTVTGPLGVFELEVPDDVQSVSLLVLPFGHAARLLTWAPRASAESASSEPQGLEIVVPAQGGALVVETHEDRGRGLELRQGRTRVPLSFFREWILFHGGNPEGTDGRIEIPALEAGSYSVCDARRGAPSCAAGDLARGSHLELRLRTAAEFLSPDGVTELTLDDDRR